MHYHRSEAEAGELVRELVGAGVRAAAVGADLSRADLVDGLIARCAEVLAPPVCLVNNASVFAYDMPSDFTAEGWNAHLDVNLRAPMQLARDFARQLPEKASGCIVNLLDQKIANLNPDFFSYTVSKIALEGATRLLAMALAPRVRVCAIAPGLTLQSGEQTADNFAAARRVAPLGQTGSLEDIVATLLYCLNTPSLTGQTIYIDGGQRFIALDRDVMFKVS